MQHKQQREQVEAGFVQFVRQIMRENELGDFDKSRLSTF